MKNAKIYYYRFPAMPSRAAKLQLIKETKFEAIPFEKITPDEKGNWINQTDNDFQNLIPLCAKEVKLGKSKDAIFELFSNGVSTNRDEWVYDLSKENLEKKMRFFLDEYNSEVERWIQWKIDNQYQDVKEESNPVVDDFLHQRNHIKWSKMIKRDKLRKGKKGNFDFDDIKKALYRPFSKKFIYYGYIPIDLKGEFPNILNENNEFISISGTSQKPFHCIASNEIVDLHFTGDSVCLPLYRYTSTGEKQDNISDWALEKFRNHYQLLKTNDTNVITNSPLVIQKTDIFHYVYAVLHSPAYRKKYELDLKREFPRIPLYEDFWKYAQAGKKLMDLHIHYENLNPSGFGNLTGLQRKDIPLDEFLKNLQGRKSEPINISNVRISPILKIAGDSILIDELTTLEGLPAEALEYKLGNRSAVEWVLDQYKPYKSADKTIQERFNNYDFAQYKEQVIDLVQKVVYVSVETMKIVKEL